MRPFSELLKGRLGRRPVAGTLSLTPLIKRNYPHYVLVPGPLLVVAGTAARRAALGSPRLSAVVALRFLDTTEVEVCQSSGVTRPSLSFLAAPALVW